METTKPGFTPGPAGALNQPSSPHNDHDEVPRLIDLDEIHNAALEVANGLDRDYQHRHPTIPGYIRPAIAHELCAAYGYCVETDHIVVAFISPGSRLRGAYGAVSR